MNFSMPLKQDRRIIALLGVVLFVIASQAFTLQVQAMPSYSESINGTITMSGEPVEGANVTLIKLSQMEDVWVNQSFSDSDGFYRLGGAYTINQYWIIVSFDDVQHSKYYRSDMYNETDFDFSGTIEAEVTGVAGELSGYTVGLYNLLGENEQNATTDAEGIAVFEKVDTKDTYYATLTYQGIRFSSQAEFMDGSVSNPKIEVLEPTKSDQGFGVAFHHVIIQKEEDVYSVRDSFSAQNMAENVFNASWLKGTIPKEAQSVTHDTMDCCINFYQTGDFEFDPMTPLFPGDTTDLALAYQLDAKPSQILDKKVVYPTEQMIILVKKTEKVTAEAVTGVTLRSIQAMGDNEYYFFEADSLDAGETIQIRLQTEVPLLERLPDYKVIIDSFPLAIPLVMVLGYFAYQRYANQDEEPDEIMEEDLL